MLYTILASPPDANGLERRAQRKRSDAAGEALYRIAYDRSDLCREMSASQRAWTGAITYNPNGTVRTQTQPSPIA